MKRSDISIELLGTATTAILTGLVCGIVILALCVWILWDYSHWMVLQEKSGDTMFWLFLISAVLFMAMPLACYGSFEAGRLRAKVHIDGFRNGAKTTVSIASGLMRAATRYARQPQSSINIVNSDDGAQIAPPPPVPQLIECNLDNNG